MEYDVNQNINIEPPQNLGQNEKIGKFHRRAVSETITLVGSIRGSPDQLSPQIDNFSIDGNDEAFTVVPDAFDDLRRIHQTYKEQLTATVKKVSEKDIYELALESKEISWRNRLEELQEDHADKVESLKKDLDNAKLRKDTVAKTAHKKLKAKDEALKVKDEELKAKDDTTQRMLATHQALQQRFDTVDEKHQSEVSILQRSNEDKDRIIAELRVRVHPSSVQQQATLNVQAATIQGLQQDKETLEAHLRTATDENDILKPMVADYEKERGMWEERARYLADALEQNPGCTNHDDLLGQKDRMFAVLEKRAADCYAAMEKLEKESGESKEQAAAKIALQDMLLENQKQKMDFLKDFKELFERELKDVFEMLKGRITGNDYADSLSHFYDLLCIDNAMLKEKVNQQTIELTMAKIVGENSDVCILDSRDKVAAQEAREIDLREELRAAKVDRDSSKAELDIVRVHKNAAIDRRDHTIAGLRQQVEQCIEETRFLITQHADNRTRWLMDRKDEEIASLQQYLQNAQQRIDHLLRVPPIIED